MEHLNGWSMLPQLPISNQQAAAKNYYPLAMHMAQQPEHKYENQNG
jgi:hypothetical protein